MDPPALQIYRADTATVEGLPVRGIGWVLRWAAVIAVFGGTLLVLTAFACQLSAEQALRQAARAGLREATLPRSTAESVAAVVRSHLSMRPRLQRASQQQLTANGVPVVGPVRVDAGTILCLSISVPASRALPRWLAPVAGNSPLRVHVVQTPRSR